MLWIETPNDEAKYHPVSQPRHFVQLFVLEGGSGRIRISPFLYDLGVKPFQKGLTEHKHRKVPRRHRAAQLASPSAPCHPAQRMSPIQGAEHETGQSTQYQCPATQAAHTSSQVWVENKESSFPMPPLYSTQAKLVQQGKKKMSLFYAESNGCHPGYWPACLGHVSIFYSIWQRFNNIWWCEMCCETRERPL